MLKRQGMSKRAIAHRLGVSEKAIRKLVGPSKSAERAQIAFAEITAVAMGKPSAAPLSSPAIIDRYGAPLGARQSWVGTITEIALRLGRNKDATTTT
jgi:hypothetical protein